MNSRIGKKVESYHSPGTSGFSMIFALDISRERKYHDKFLYVSVKENIDSVR